jgi:hypothetical protein
MRTRLGTSNADNFESVGCEHSNRWETNVAPTKNLDYFIL